MTLLNGGLAWQSQGQYVSFKITIVTAVPFTTFRLKRSNEIRSKYDLHRFIPYNIGRINGYHNTTVQKS